MLALCSLGGNPRLSSTKSSVHHYVEKAQFFFHYSIVLVPKAIFFLQECNIFVKLIQATMWPGLWRGIVHGWFPFNSLLLKQCCIVRVLTLIPIVSELLSISYETTFGSLLTSWHNFRTVLGDNLGFFHTQAILSYQTAFAFTWMQIT